MKIGVVSPGDMGSGVGRRLLAHGVDVLTYVGDRSDRTQGLARDAGFRTVPSLDDLVKESELVLSIVVPARAHDVAGALAAAIERTGSSPVVLDCNSISPGTVKQLGGLVSEAGGRFMDASIIGPPPRTDVSTVLYISGPFVAECAGLAEHGLRVTSLGDEIGRASALKMSYAALTKGLGVLSVQLLLTACVNGVYEELFEIMDENVPELARFMSNRVPQIPMKAFRFVGEMEELDSVVAEAGIPGGTFESIARVCEWLATSTLAAETPETRDLSRTVHETVEMLAEPLLT